MNVKELKAIISSLPDDMLIIMQGDSEGNYIHDLADANPRGVYDSEIMEVYEESWTADDACLEEDEWEALKSQPRVLVLWPA